MNNYDPGCIFICGPGIGKKNPEDTINKFYKIGYIRQSFEKITELKYNELVELKNAVEELDCYYLRKQNLNFVFPLPHPFKDWFDEIEEQMQKYHQWYFNNIITLSEEQEVNGYKLYNITKDMMSVDMFLQYVEMWEKNEEMTIEEFEKEFYNKVCTEWYKMDRNGESYGGFYKYPEGSSEKDDAWNLTIKDNMIGLYELPYPKKFVLETIKLGCNNRMECVRYSNMICELYKQKFDFFMKNKN